MSLKKLSIITIIVLLMALVVNLGVSKSAMASKEKWYTSTTYSDSKKVKVTIDNPSKMTNKSVKITIDASNYNNGDNVIVFNPGDNNSIVTYGSEFSTKVADNGDYSFMVERKDYYDPKYGDPKTIWCGAEINNIDKKKPTIKFMKKYLDDWSTIEYLKVNIIDNVGLYRIKLPDGSYDDSAKYVNDRNTRLTENPVNVEVYKNGKYTFEAVDLAGNKTIKSFTVKDNKSMPLKVDKVTVKSKYITGKTLPYAKLIVKSEDLDYYADDIKADKKGYYKAKLNKKLKLNEKIVVRSMDYKNKYSSNKIKVQVINK